MPEPIDIAPGSASNSSTTAPAQKPRLLKGIGDFFKLLRNAGGNFLDDDGMKLSASLSYYAIFSLAPLIIIIMSVAGIFMGQDAAQGRIYGQINGYVGNTTALYIQDLIKNIEHSHKTVAGTILGAVVLMIGVTGIFTEIQHSINYIWSIRAKPKKGWVKMLFNRLISFILVVSFAVILFLALVADSASDLLSNKLKNRLPDLSVYLFNGINLVIIFCTIACLFAIIYKVLPDARIRWKDSFVGAVFTAFLFMLGKLAISFYLGKSNVGITYGTAASIVILLLWVYYSSIILFFGAEFTRAFALHYGGGVQPNETSVFIIKREAKEIDIAPLT
jgi:membrane protein